MGDISIDSTTGGQVRPLDSIARNLTEDVHVIRRDLGVLAGLLSRPDIEPEIAAVVVQLVGNVGMLDSNVADLTASVEHDS